jgi:hypothetical protein
MLNTINETFLDSLVERVAQALLRLLLPRIEARIDAAIKMQPRWLSLESAAAYIDKTYEGMRYTLKEYSKEIPTSMVGGKIRIDIKDIDRFMLNQKSK